MACEQVGQVFDGLPIGPPGEYSILCIPHAKLSQHELAGHPLLLTLSLDIVGAVAAYACSNYLIVAFLASCFPKGSEPQSCLKVHGLTPRLGGSGLVASRYFANVLHKPSRVCRVAR